MKIEPTQITGSTIVEVWRNSANLLIKDGPHLNLFVHIARPDLIDLKELSTYDPKRIDASAMSLYDVANTIFPAESPKWKLSTEAFTKYYIPVYERLGRSTPYSWGFYFQRLTAFGPAKANQLLRIVDGLNGWGRNHHAAFVAHFSSSEIDKPRPLGAPCLQYIQLMRGEKNELTLTAVYRSHDYFLKTLGNFLGLSRILAYICGQTGLTMGPISCLSTYAFLGKSRAKAKELLTGNA